MRRAAVVFLVVLAGLVALSAPAFPALSRFAALPHKAAGPVNVLLAGVDVDYDWSSAVWPYPAKPEQYDQRTDTIMLAQMWPDGRTNLLSIPRDTWVDIPGKGWSKINAANPTGGPDLLVRTVQDLTSVPIDAYALLSLNALRAVAEAAGGVTVDVPTRMKYDDNAGHLHIDLQPGRQHLSGEQVEGFLRFRHDNMGDIGRVARQQAFLTALTGQMKNPLNWWRLPRMVAAIDGNMKTNLTRPQLGALLGGALSGPKINTYTVPGTFGGPTWVPDRAGLASLIEEHFRDPNDPRALTVAVVNVGAPGGSARRVKERLEGLGYRDVVTSNGERADVPTTVSGTSAQTVLRDVGYGQLSQEPGVPGADVTVRLGNDIPAN
ncbi:LCP family protein [Deinococcus apachensis]|uniref:LCP family protein n=1 Tax=Deinococcus apachensis TaxID=309886 RepID=UPI00036DDA77|nr:LCP family protein [Deinococcus apachensis]